MKRKHLLRRIPVLVVLLVMAFGGSSTFAHTSFRPYQVDQIDLRAAGLVYPTFIVMHSSGKKAYVALEESGQVAEIDLTTNKVSRSFVTEPEPYRIALSPDERYVLTAGDKWASVIDVAEPATSGQTQTGVFGNTIGLCMFPCGVSNQVNSDHGSQGFTLTSIAMGPGNKIYLGKIDRYAGEHALVTMDLDKQLLASAQQQGHVHEGHDHTGVHSRDTIPVIDWDSATNVVIPGIAEPDGIAITRDGRMAYVVNQNESKLLYIDLVRHKLVAIVPTGIPNLMTPFEYVPHPGDSLDLVLSKDERLAFVSNTRSGSIAVVDLEQRAVVRLIRTEGSEGGAYGIALSPDGQYLYGAMWGMNELQVVDIASGKVTQRINVGTGPIGVAATPDGKRVLVANSRDDTISVITFVK